MWCLSRCSRVPKRRHAMESFATPQTWLVSVTGQRWPAAKDGSMCSTQRRSCGQLPCRTAHRSSTPQTSPSLPWCWSWSQAPSCASQVRVASWWCLVDGNRSRKEGLSVCVFALTVYSKYIENPKEMWSQLMWKVSVHCYWIAILICFKTNFMYTGCFIDAGTNWSIWISKRLSSWSSLTGLFTAAVSSVILGRLWPSSLFRVCVTFYRVTAD